MAAYLERSPVDLTRAPGAISWDAIDLTRDPAVDLARAPGAISWDAIDLTRDPGAISCDPIDLTRDPVVDPFVVDLTRVFRPHRDPHRARVYARYFA